MTGRLNNDNPTTMAPIRVFFLPRPFQGSKKFRVFIMAKTETEHRRRKGELRKRLLQKELRELPARGLQMGFPQIVLMHQGQQATGATEGRARTTGRSRLRSNKWPQWPWENSRYLCKAIKYRVLNQTFTGNCHSQCSSFSDEVMRYTI